MGRLVGKAVVEGILLDAHFTRPFYKHMLGQAVSFLDLQAVDPEFYKVCSVCTHVCMCEVFIFLRGAYRVA